MYSLRHYPNVIHFVGQQIIDDEEDGYAVPHNAAARPTLPPPPGKGRIVIGPNAAPNPPTAQQSSETSRRRLPNRPQMPIFPQGQRALPGTTHIYGNILDQSTTAAGNNRMPYIVSSPPPTATAATASRQAPNSAFLTNLANKRIMNNTKR